MATYDVLLAGSSSFDLVDCWHTVAEKVACLDCDATADLGVESGTPELTENLVIMGRCRRSSVAVDLVAACQEDPPSKEADSSLQGCLKVSKTGRIGSRQDLDQSADCGAQVAGTLSTTCHI